MPSMSLLERIINVEEKKNKINSTEDIDKLKKIKEAYIRDSYYSILLSFGFLVNGALSFSVANYYSSSDPKNTVLSLSIGVLSLASSYFMVKVYNVYNRIAEHISNRLFELEYKKK